MNTTDVEKFIAAFSSASTTDEMNQALAVFSSTMGFNQFGLTIIIPSCLSRPRVAIFAHCDNEWEQIYKDNALLSRDPVIHLSLRQNTPVFWHTLTCASCPSLPDGSIDVMGMAADCGLKNGVTFPLKSQTGEVGILSFITSDEVSAHLLEASQTLRFLADYIFETAIRIVSKQVRSSENKLSGRELECLLWASEGKTASEIGTILGITARTVSYYMHQAVVKTDSVNRDQAISKALMAGLLRPRLDRANIDID